MNIGETGFPEELRDTPAGAGAALLHLIGQAVLAAMIEDWTVESVEGYRASGGIVADRQLPDDTIEPGSATQRRLMQWLAGELYPVDYLAASVRDFLSLTVSGSGVLEEETALCRVVWVRRGEIAEPVFFLPAANVEWGGI